MDQSTIVYLNIIMFCLIIVKSESLCGRDLISKVNEPQRKCFLSPTASDTIHKSQAALPWAAQKNPHLLRKTAVVACLLIEN